MAKFDILIIATRSIINMDKILLLLISIWVVIQGAQLSTKYAEKLAEGFHLSRYVVGFFVVSAISILPELFISINASIKGDPAFGIGTLFGSNVADLTIIFTILTFVAGKNGFRVEKATLSKLTLYPLFLLIPLILGLDGAFTREEGFVLIIVGLIFYIIAFRKSVGIMSHSADTHNRWRNFFMLLLGLAVLLIGAHFTVESAIGLANEIGVSSVLIGILIVSLGTTIPELSFSMKAVRSKRPEMAIGDIFGSVLADATIVVGFIAVLSPFSFPQRIAYIAGITMVIASVILLILMRSNRRLGRREGIALALVWLAYVLLEVFFAK